MSCVDIRGCRIGEGRPKVILPIVERAEAAILEKAAQFSTLQADCVEWRVDYFEGARAPGAVARCLAKMRVILRDKLLLVTIRTKAEGGQVALSPAEYRQFLELVLDTDCADLLDIEFFTAGADLPKLAVMPRCRTDVLELLAATAEMADLHPETPVITMSMGTLGAVSRLAGEAFGSAMTFANPGQASAPGQVSLNIVNEVLDALHL